MITFYKLESTLIIISVSITFFLLFLNVPLVSPFKLQKASSAGDGDGASDSDSLVPLSSASTREISASVNDANEMEVTTPLPVSVSVSVAQQPHGKRNNLLNSTYIRLQSKSKSTGVNVNQNQSHLRTRTNVRPSSASATSLRNKTKILHVLGLFELTENGTVRTHGRSEKYAAELAINDINRRRILRNYQLVLQTNDTRCDAGVGVDAFFHALYANMNSSKRIVSLLGTACSEVTERLAKVVPYWNMVQISFGSTSPSLSDRKEFPLFFRTVSTASSHNEAMIEFIHHFRWDTVTFFTYNENKFTLPANFLLSELEKANVTCKATLTFSLSDLQDQLQDMKDLDSRIIIASFGSDLAPQIFCEVYRLGMFGSEYVWILIGKPETSWWLSPSEPYYFYSAPAAAHQEEQERRRRRDDDATGAVGDAFIEENGNFSYKFSHYSSNKLREALPFYFHQTDNNYIHNQLNQVNNCSPKELSKVIEYALVVDRHNFLISNMTSISGMKASNFRAKFYRRKLEESPFAPETYDAVWSLALALKSVQERHNISLESFQYNDTNFSDKLMEELSQLVFAGISGPVSFSGPDRIGVTSFMQIIGGEMKQVGLYFPHESYLQFNCSDCTPLRWFSNQVPIARREFRFKIIQVENSLHIIVAFLASAGILMALGFLFFNLYNRKLKYIKLSSPKLNNIVIFGCIFAYLAVILLGSDFGSEPDLEHFDYMCAIRAYLLSTGFSLAFGAMFAKTYRVHRIFTRSCAGVVRNRLLKDRQLMSLILALLVIDSVIVSSWSAFDPMHRKLQNLTLEIDPSDRSVVYQNQIEVCISQQGHVWLSILYGYKGLLLVVGLYMAWETRNVKIQALNDSKYIGICVYIVVLTSVLAVSLVNLISERVTLSFVCVTALILTSTTMTLCLLFLPKIHAIVKKSNVGDPVVESLGLKIEFNTRRFMVEDTKEIQFRAEVQNRVFKRQIELIDAEIWKVEKLLMAEQQQQQEPSVTPRTPTTASSRLTTVNALVNSAITCTKNLGEISGQEYAHAGGASSKDLQKHATTTRSANHMNAAHQDSSTSSLTSGSDEGDSIYAVYLHRPRFIIPISLFSLRSFTNNNHGNVLSSIAAIAASALGSKAPVATAPTTTTTMAMAPRSSWPSQTTTAVNRHVVNSATGALSLAVPRRFRFCSEPRLTDTIDVLDSSLVKESTKKASSAENVKSRTQVETPSRKSSACSTSNASTTTRKQIFLNFLKAPISFVADFVQRRASIRAAGHRRDRIHVGSQLASIPADQSLYQYQRNLRYSSVPNLYVIHNSPVLNAKFSPRAQYKKHGSLCSSGGEGTSESRRPLSIAIAPPQSSFSSGNISSLVEEEGDGPSFIVEA